MFAEKQKCFTFASASYMVVVAQLVRASVCGTEGRRFEPGLPPKIKGLFFRPFFVNLKVSFILLRAFKYSKN